MRPEKYIVLFLNQKVEEEFLSLAADIKAHYLHIVSLIEEFGPMNVGMPHIRFLGDKLWEIRLRGRDGIARAIYTNTQEKKLIILYVFVKKTQKTPQAAIKIALKRMKEI